MPDGAHLSTIKGERAGAWTAEQIGQACVQYRGLLYGLAMRYTRGDRDAADELVHETVICALRWHASYDPERGAISTWLRWVFRSAAQHERQKRERRRGVESAASLTYENDDGELAEIEIAVAPTQEIALEAAELRDEIAKLPERQQFILLSRAEGYALEELAGVLGVSKERVRQIEGVARQHLIERMEARETGRPIPEGFRRTRGYRARLDAERTKPSSPRM